MSVLRHESPHLDAYLTGSISELVEARRLLPQASWVHGLQIVGPEIAALHRLIGDPLLRLFSGRAGEFLITLARPM